MPPEESQPNPVGEAEASAEQEVQKVHALLQTLKNYEVDRPYGTPDEVDRAVSIIKRVCSAHKEALDRYGLIPTLHGSLQYHDPRNLDVDITMFNYHKLPREEFIALHHVLEESFDRLEDWPRDSVETDISFVGLDEIKSKAEELESSSVESVEPWEDTAWENMSPDFMAMLLNCSPIFPDQQEAYTNLQNEGWKLLQSHPTLRARTIKILQDTVNVREERRRELGK